MLANTLFLDYKRELVTIFIVTITTFNKSQTIVKALAPSGSTTITPIFSNTLSDSYGGAIVSLNAFVKNLKAYTKIISLPPINLPNFLIEDSETDKLYKSIEVEWNSPRKQLNLYISDNQTNWYEIGAISLLNPSGYPYRVYNLMDIVTDNLAIELGENGRLGVQVQDVGFGALANGDSVTIHGSYIQEITIDSGNPAIETINDFEVAINTKSTVILAANSFRKYAAFTNNGNSPIYLNLGEVATLNKGIYLTPAGSFDFDKPYFGIVSAISVDGIGSISGIECN